MIEGEYRTWLNNNNKETPYLTLMGKGWVCPLWVFGENVPWAALCKSAVVHILCEVVQNMTTLRMKDISCLAVTVDEL